MGFSWSEGVMYEYHDPDFGWYRFWHFQDEAGDHTERQLEEIWDRASTRDLVHNEVRWR